MSETINTQADRILCDRICVMKKGVESTLDSSHQFDDSVCRFGLKEIKTKIRWHYKESLYASVITEWNYESQKNVQLILNNANFNWPVVRMFW